MELPFAITLDVGSSDANRTGSWRVERPIYVDRLPPCNDACPAGENIQRWLYQAEPGDYEMAWRQLVEDNPFPAVMGRICYHPCETACNRAQLDQAVGINAIERFLGDRAIERGWSLPPAVTDSGKRVLVVGAGPDDEDPLPAVGHRRRQRPTALDRPVTEEPLDGVDPDRLVELGAIARRLARVVADATHHRGERVVLDELAPSHLVVTWLGLVEPALDVLARRARIVARREPVDVDRSFDAPRTGPVGVARADVQCDCERKLHYAVTCFGSLLSASSSMRP